PHPSKSINLFHCLNELGDHSLVEKIQQYLKSGTIKEVKLSSSQWSAVAFVLLTSEKNLDEFRLKEFVGAENKADHILQKLVPVIKESRRSNLCKCGVTDEGCAALASVLRSNSSQLRELHLSDNELGDFGVMRLSSGLEIPDCKLEILRLSGCGLADEGCAALASALRSNPEHLRELDLAENILGDSGVEYLSSGLKNPHLKLEILSANATQNSSFLTQMKGVFSLNKRLVAGIEECVIVLYRLYNCGITGKGCAALASALRSNTSHLRELDLADNELEDSGVEILSTGLLNPECKLEILRHLNSQ
uniref:NACHT LRR and PYD domain-containing protein n=1 Tax=Cyprinus carpio TaxID=7962 RepID=A0A8C1JVE9_CYPCA